MIVSTQLLIRKFTLVGVVIFVLSLANPSLVAGQVGAAGQSAVISSIDLSQYIARTWTTADGLPVNHIFQVLQSRDGFIWIATANGPVRFDGVSFEPFSPENTESMSTSYTLDISSDADGALWFGTPDESIRLKNGEFTSIPIETGGPNALFHFDSDGKGWFIDKNELFLTREGTLGLYSTFDQPPPSDVLQSLETQSNDQLLIITEEGRLLTIRDGQFLALNDLERLLDTTVARMVPDKKGGIWLITFAGDLFHFENGRLQNHGAPPGMEEGFSGSNLVVDASNTLWILVSRSSTWSYKFGEFNSYVISIIHHWVDAQGTLWGDTVTGDLYKMLDGRVEQFPIREFAGSRVVTSVISGREGVLWVGTDVGLHQFVPKRTDTDNRLRELSGRLMRPILQSGDGSVWLGSWGNGLSRLHDDTLQTFTDRDGLPSDDIWTLLEDTKGQIWVGTNLGGLAVLAEDSTQFKVVAPGTVRAVEETTDGRIWFSVLGHSALRTGLYYVENGIVHEFTIDGDSDFSQIWAIKEDTRGILWVGSVSGLYRIEGDNVERFTTKDGLSQNFVVSVYEDSGGDLWFSTQSGGLNRLWNDGFIHYTRSDGLYSDGVWSILEDDRGFFWMSSDQGVFRVSKTELDKFATGEADQVSSIWYTESDGMPSAECNRAQPAGWKTSDGLLWFPTLMGPAVFDPRDETLLATSPYIAIRRIRADGESVRISSPIRLVPGDKQLTFEFSVLSYIAPEKNKVRYMLEGLDSSWIESDGNRSASYFNVHPGKYTFRVTGANSNGVWNEKGQAISLSFRPHFYESRWFYFGLFVLVSASVLFAVGARLKLDRQRESENTRQRIARDLHDDIGSRIGSIALKLELSQRDLLTGGDTATTLSDSIAIVRKLSTDFRDSIWILHSDQSGLVDLADRIRLVGQRILETNCHTFSCPDDLPDLQIEMETRRHIYLIAKEAIYNAARHANGAGVDIDFGFKKGRLILCISDNGSGFDDSKGQLGRGLDNMLWRAEKIGAELLVTSDENEGTMVCLEVELT